MNDDDKIIGLKIKLRECEHGSLHITGIEPIRESATVYSAPGADKILGSAKVGWSPMYAANWDANFGAKADDAN